MRTCAAFFVTLFSGCYMATSRPVMAPDGSQANYIECPGSQAKCLDRAADACPVGYDVLGGSSQQGAVTQSFYGPYSSTAITQPIYSETMLIKCWPRCNPGDLRFRNHQGGFVCVNPIDQRWAMAQGMVLVP
jgi:hypothetical protein